MKGNVNKSMQNAVKGKSHFRVSTNWVSRSQRRTPFTLPSKCPSDTYRKGLNARRMKVNSKAEYECPPKEGRGCRGSKKWRWGSLCFGSGLARWGFSGETGTPPWDVPRAFVPLSVGLAVSRSAAAFPLAIGRGDPKFILRHDMPRWAHRWCRV